MAEQNITLIRTIPGLKDARSSLESASDGLSNLGCHWLNGKLTFNDIDWYFKVVVALLSSEIELLIQSVKELVGRTSSRSTEMNLLPNLSRPLNNVSTVRYATVKQNTSIARDCNFEQL